MELANSTLMSYLVNVTTYTNLTTPTLYNNYTDLHLLYNDSFTSAPPYYTSTVAPPYTTGSDDSTTSTTTRRSEVKKFLQFGPPLIDEYPGDLAPHIEPYASPPGPGGRGAGGGGRGSDQSIKLIGHSSSRNHITKSAHHRSDVSRGGVSGGVSGGSEVSSIRVTHDVSTFTYVTLVCVFYGAALAALLVSLCCRRRSAVGSAAYAHDKQDYYEKYMINKERVHRMSLMQKLRRIRRLWDAANLYKMPVDVI